MFNFFNKSTKSEYAENPESEEQNYASIQFYVDEIGGPSKVSVVLDDYTEECCDAMCTILTTLTEEGTAIETFNIIRSFLEDDGRQDIVLKLAMKIGEQQKKKDNTEVSDEPCIKPSDMIL